MALDNSDPGSSQPPPSNSVTPTFITAISINPQANIGRTTRKGLDIKQIVSDTYILLHTIEKELHGLEKKYTQDGHYLPLVKKMAQLIEDDFSITSFIARKSEVVSHTSQVLAQELLDLLNSAQRAFTQHRRKAYKQEKSNFAKDFAEYRKQYPSERTMQDEIFTRAVWDYVIYTPELISKELRTKEGLARFSALATTVFSKLSLHRD